MGAHEGATVDREGADPAKAPEESTVVYNDRIKVEYDEAWCEQAEMKLTLFSHELHWYHVIFISVTGILGAGLYSRSGEMLQVGGPGAVILPYAIFGLLAWLIMQCIGEMVCIWPISNALVLFVQKFVDHELGTAVGVAYWMAYSIGFASLLAAAAAETQLWTCSPVISGVLFLFAAALVIFIVNCLGVKRYGDIEVVLGFVKIVMIVVVVALMIAINSGVGMEPRIGWRYWSNSTIFFANDYDEAPSWGSALFIGLHIAAWSFVGIEIPMVIALETEITTTSASPHVRTSSYGTLRWSMMWLPIFVACTYLVAGMMASLNVPATDSRLPRQLSDVAWTEGRCTKGESSSVFVISMLNSNISGLPDAVAAFFILTAWSSANTALYVSSRVLFSLCCDMADEDSPTDSSRLVLWWWKFRQWLGKTSRTHDEKRVPIAAILVSALAFVWAPFLSLPGAGGPAYAVPPVLSSMASVCCVVVWTCECVAFVSFRVHMKIHHEEITRDESLRFLLAREDGGDSWQAWGQPFLAGVTVTCCLVVLIVADGAPIWIGWGGLSGAIFATAYIPLFCFLVLWAILKVVKYGWNPLRKVNERHAWWPHESLRNWNNGFKVILEDLKQLRERRLRSG